MDHEKNMAMMLQIAQNNVGSQAADIYAESCTAAIRSMNAIGSIKSEMQKMDEEIQRCYEIANKNAIYGLKQEEAIWNARAQAFADCIKIVEKCFR